ncbi:MAG: hypothetical protein JST00_41440 [Deltaproteobacteria bacterium]|nr:hypothetical protein [Deltaproteobacteria bacterium]
MRKRIGSALVVVASISVAACAALLGIDERSPLEDTEASTPDGSVKDGGTEETSPVDGAFEVSTITDASCDAVSCGAAGGSCVSGACQIHCNASCNTRPVDCPPDTDCQVICEAGTCTDTTCAGGRSCTLECAKDSCLGSKCTSERCTFRCGESACGNAQCEAGVSCLFDCFGATSCDEAPGIGGNAGSTCDIRCSGAKACGGGGGGDPPNATLRCVAPDSGITCTAVSESCKDSVLYCKGEKCAIDCQGNSSCEDGYCCEAGICQRFGRALDGGIKDRCP